VQYRILPATPPSQHLPLPRIKSTVTTPAPLPDKLREWVDLIRNEEMPIFDHTVHKVLAVSRDELAPASELAQVVLQDVTLMTRVLKLANSVYYNPMGLSISTISRAVIVLGFNAVRNMTLAVSLVDAMVKGAARRRLTQELGRSIHTAVQARALAIENGDRSPEEIFIAALLLNIGPLAFWCFSGKIGDELDRALREPGVEPGEAEMAILGFPLQQLSAELANGWNISPLLSDSINNPDTRDPRARAIFLGRQIAETAEKSGWHSKEMEQLIHSSADFIQLPPNEMQLTLFQKAREAADMAADFGARYAAVQIPIPGKQRDMHEMEEPPPPPAPPSPFMQPDGMLQLKILRELSQMVEEQNLDFNLILELVIEGIYRGVGVDRVLIALTSPDKKSIKAKFALGHEHEKITREFHFLRVPQQPHILFQALERKLSLYVDIIKRKEVETLVPPQMINVIGRTPFIIAPITIHQQPIGLFYADRSISGRTIDNDTFENFKHFVIQGNIALSHAIGRRR
jgi:HD-like signal output (HDOD) protein